jgi:hypothetical protein
MISARLLKLACYAAISEALYFSTAFFASSNFFEKFFSEVQPSKTPSLNRLAFQRSLKFYTEYFRIRQEFKIFLHCKIINDDCAMHLHLSIAEKKTPSSYAGRFSL